MKKILVIEDNQEVRENLEEVLELYGYAVESAENGKTGVQMALNNVPDLILCDVMMPELDGYGVLNILSKRRETAGVPFIFLTAKAEKEDFRRGMNLGADDYITKPFYKDELLQVIETRLKKSERLKQPFNGLEGGFHAFINEARGYEELKRLSSERRVKTYQKKEHLFDEGSYPRYLYYVNQGKVKMYKTNEFGKEFIIDIVGEGNFLGYTALIQDTTFNYSAAALEETEISLIPKEDFNQLIFANRDVASRLIKMLARNVAVKEEQLLHLAYDSVRKRVANALILLHDRYQEEGREEIRILREDLARLVGTAKESVIRMLSEFKDDGFIDIVDGIITILKRDQLEKIMG
jgi:CRP-like cAMP-binding protein/CheY-like chemotaxis protein